jgi:hypothetical protein
MKSHLILVLLLATGTALAGDAPKKKPAPPAKPAAPAAAAKDDKPAAKDDDPNLGMSILGNQEAPKALVIVPWKSSEIGKSLGIATMLDDSRQPVDREVFMRMLSYYAIRSNPTAGDAAPTGRKQ